MMQNIAIGQRLLQLRREMRITRQSLAQITNISAHTLKSWEEGATTIRQHNLEKYLNELQKIGCFATIEWVMNGGATIPLIEAPQTQTIISSHKLGSTDVEAMIDILSVTSNLFYYIDSQEHIMYINADLLPLLGNTSYIAPEMINNMPFKDICSEATYNLFREHFKLCYKGRKQKLSYNLSSPYSKTPHIVEMLCCPVTKSKSNKVMGILGFVSNTTAKLP